MCTWENYVLDKPGTNGHNEEIKFRNSRLSKDITEKNQSGPEQLLFRFNLMI